MADRVTISAGTTHSPVRSANRTARVAEASLLAGLGEGDGRRCAVARHWQVDRPSQR